MRPKVRAVALHATIVVAYSTPNTTSSSRLPPGTAGCRERGASPACGRAGARRSVDRHLRAAGSRRGSPRCRGPSPSANRAPRARRRRSRTRRARPRPVASGRSPATAARPRSPRARERRPHAAQYSPLERPDPLLQAVDAIPERQPHVGLEEGAVLAGERGRRHDVRLLERCPASDRSYCAHRSRARGGGHEA